MILNRVKDYYGNDKERLREQARDTYRNLKKKKKEYGKNRYHYLSEEKNQRLKQYQKNYHVAKKSQYNNE